MLAAGFDLKEPYLQDNLNGLFKGSLRYLTKKLCIPMPVSALAKSIGDKLGNRFALPQNTAYLYGVDGVVDESGILEGNQVYVCITGSYEFAGTVMVTRNPKCVSPAIHIKARLLNGLRCCFSTVVTQETCDFV